MNIKGQLYKTLPFLLFRLEYTGVINNPHDIHTYPYSFQENDSHEGESHESALLHKLENIHTILMAINESLSNPSPKELMDERFIQVLYKVGQGPNWIPSRRGKFYLYIMAPVATVLNVTSPLGPPIVLTIPAVTLPGMWNLFDLPDQASVNLDATASANQMSIFVLITDVKL